MYHNEQLNVSDKSIHVQYKPDSRLPVVRFSCILGSVFVVPAKTPYK
jgi:hypothetical protein